MGRPLPRKISQLGWRILARLKELDLEPGAVAAAAGIAPSTLYRLMKEGKPGEATIDPRLRTKRRLARVLKVSIADLFAQAQLEILSDPEPASSSPVEPLERLILYHYRQVSSELRGIAMSAAVSAVIDYVLSVAVHDPRPQLPPLNESDIPGTRNDSERMLLNVFRRLPASMRSEAARFVVQSMIDVQLAAGEAPDSVLFRAVERARWPEARLRRDRPPLSGEGVA